MAQTTSAPLTSDRFDFSGADSKYRELIGDMLGDASIVTFADDLSEILDDSERILDYCRAAYDGMAGAEKPAQRREVLAVAATARLAMRKFPNDPDRRKAAWKIPANRPDGASVSGTAIAHRAEAYADVVAAGVTPTKDTVKEAFRLTSTGGSKEYRERRDAAVAKGEDFVKATDKAMKDLLAANRKKKTAQAAKAQAAAQAAEAVKYDSDKGTAADVVFALEWAHANIARFSASERDDIRKALAVLAADFAPAK